eukprot:TRINITY_DN7735_c0_g2_i1.p2 TRINITY_DN7735_c0_g2~~TRINITY_DN7735_c0_g2_i1.p2  ORF type:complete len:188 (+),score=28.34 TRINITY_DN7735_c0_g2_i1:144-707(+)
MDYMGWRLAVSSIIPIDTRKPSSTLIYGSENGGVTFLDESAVMRHKMKQLAEKLNLRGHWVVGSQDGKKHFLYSCADLEGHKAKDGRLYILDTARVFPCEMPAMRTIEEGGRIVSKLVVKGAHLFNMLRPEFIATLSKPLSSDVFLFRASEEAKYDEDVLIATKQLIEELIPILKISPKNFTREESI